MLANKNTKARFTFAGIWLACVVAAVGLAVATPHEPSLVGQMPAVAARSGDQRALQLPRELPGARTLALLMFNQQQKEEVRTWIRGMRLKESEDLAWVKLQVGVGQGGETHVKSARSLLVSADRDSIVQALRLRGDDRMQALVLDREGNVLARAEGAWDEDKGQSILLALLAP